jgi:hypothetical protein
MYTILLYTGLFSISFATPIKLSSTILPMATAALIGDTNGFLSPVPGKSSIPSTRSRSAFSLQSTKDKTIDGSTSEEFDGEDSEDEEEESVNEEKGGKDKHSQTSEEFYDQIESLLQAIENEDDGEFDFDDFDDIEMPPTEDLLEGGIDRWFGSLSTSEREEFLVDGVFKSPEEEDFMNNLSRDEQEEYLKTLNSDETDEFLKSNGVVDWCDFFEGWEKEESMSISLSKEEVKEEKELRKKLTRGAAKKAEVVRKAWVSRKITEDKRKSLVQRHQISDYIDEYYEKMVKEGSTMSKWEFIALIRGTYSRSIAIPDGIEVHHGLSKQGFAAKVVSICLLHKSNK